MTFYALVDKSMKLGRERRPLVTFTTHSNIKQKKVSALSDESSRSYSDGKKEKQTN